MTGWARLVFVAAVIFAFVMATLPHPPPVPGAPPDKVQHIVAFVVLTLLACAGWPHRRASLIFGGLAALGAAIEFVQMIPTLNREASVLDWIADLAAVAITMGITLMIRARSVRPR